MLATLVPLLILLIAWGAIAQVFARDFGHVTLAAVVDKARIPNGSFVEVDGTPSYAVSRSNDQNEIVAFVVMQGQPGLVLFGTEHLDFTHEVQASDYPDGEYYQQVHLAAGQIVTPRDSRLPYALLDEFVKRNIRDRSVEDIRVLVVGAEPADARMEGIGGLLCVSVLAVGAFLLWCQLAWTLIKGSPVQAGDAPASAEA